MVDASVTSESKALKGWLLALVALGGQAMASLDTSIVNVAGPVMRHDLRLSGPALQLAVSGYVLVYAAGLILGARLGLRGGFMRVFRLGVAVFTASSFVCGLAPDPIVLIVARAFQGAGAALMVPQVLTMLQVHFAGEGRRRVLNAYGVVLALGVAVGQVVGGALINADLLGAGWRPVFFVNLPLGVAILLLTRREGVPSRPPRNVGVDAAGSALLGSALTALVVGGTFAIQDGWPIWTLALLGAVGASFARWFWRHEQRVALEGGDPLVEPALLRLRAVRRAMLGTLVYMTCYAALLFTLALYLEGLERFSALAAGLAFCPYALGFAAASLGWGRLPGQLRRQISWMGFGAMAVASGLLALLCWHAGWPVAAEAVLFIAGLGHGGGYGALLRSSAEARHGQAASLSGALVTASQVAIVLGIAAGGTLYLGVHHSPGAPPPIVWVFVALGVITALAGAGMAATSRPLPERQSVTPLRPLSGSTKVSPDPQRARDVEARESTLTPSVSSRVRRLPPELPQR